MNKKEFIKKVSSLAAILTLSAPLFTQNFDYSEEPPFENNPVDELSDNTFPEDDYDVLNSLINPELQKHFTIAHVSGISTLNPHLSSYSSETQILINTYEGLFSYNPINLEPQFAIAKDYKISRDKKRWTFILRDDAKYCDGTPITAEDVRNSWINLLKNPDAPYSSLFDIVKGARNLRTGQGTEQDTGIYVIDNHTLSVHLNSPAAYLPRLLCMTAFAVFPETPGLFSGAYYMYSITPTELVLRKNEHYYDHKKVHLQEISYLFSNDGDENAYLYNTGEVDWVSGPCSVDRVINKQANQLTAEFGTEFYFFRLYDENSPLKTPDWKIWRQEKFRQALLEAVPWDQLRNQTFVQASTLVYPLQGYPQVQGYNYTDVIEARNILKEARKEAGIPEDKKLSLRICVSDVLQERTQILKNAWEQIGIEVHIITVKNEEYLNAVNLTSADIFDYSWIGDFTDPLAFLELFRPDSTLNVSGWYNEDFENLISEANLCTDENHNKLMANAEQLLLDSAMVLPVQHPVTLNIINLNETGGWYANAFDLHPMKFVFKKEVKKTFPGLVKLTSPL